MQAQNCPPLERMLTYVGFSSGDPTDWIYKRMSVGFYPTGADKYSGAYDLRIDCTITGFVYTDENQTFMIVHDSPFITPLVYDMNVSVFFSHIVSEYSQGDFGEKRHVSVLIEDGEYYSS